MTTGVANSRIELIVGGLNGFTAREEISHESPVQSDTI